MPQPPRFLHVAGWFAAALALAVSAGRAHGVAQTALEPMATGVVLNATLVSDAELIHADTRRSVGFWVKASSLLAWRLLPDTAALRTIEGAAHQQVCSAGGALRCFYDESSAVLTITARSADITPLLIRATPLARAEPDDAQALGGYLNYDLFAAGGRTSSRGGYIESRVFSAAGSGYLRAGGFDTGARRRLSSRMMGWEWDLPDRATTFTAGGLYGEGSAQRPSVPMIGARYASNFSLRPDISLAPRPLVRGEVERASHADLFVDGLFRRSADVPYGSYLMEADSLLAGRGELQTVLTDARGVLTTQTQSYYYAPQLLPEGLDDFSVEAGALSPEPARLSLSRQWVGSMNLRRGWSAVQTVSATAVATRGARLVGGSTDRKLGEWGVLRLGAATLNRGTGNRVRGLLGYEFQSRRFSMLVRFEAAPGDRAAPSAVGYGTGFGSGYDRSFGNRSANPAATLLPSDKRNAIVAASVSITDRHQFNGTMYERIGLTGERSLASTVSATYRPSPRMQLSFGVQQVRFPKSGSFVVMSLLMPLDSRHLAVVSTTRTDTRNALQWAVQSQADDNGEGAERQYRVHGEIIPRASIGASYQRNETYVQWGMEVLQRERSTTALARVSGAVGLLGGHAFATQRIDDSFIVVDSDGQADLPVFYENRFAGKTNAAGKLLIPGARAHQPNQVSLDAAALPIEFTLAQDQLEVVPRSHAGAAARFEIADGGVLVPVVQANGAALPTGARALVSTQSRASAIGSASEVFIGRASRAAEVKVQWAGGECSFDYRPDNAGVDQPGGATLCR